MSATAEAIPMKLKCPAGNHTHKQYSAVAKCIAKSRWSMKVQNKIDTEGPFAVLALCGNVLKVILSQTLEEGQQRKAEIDSNGCGSHFCKPEHHKFDNITTEDRLIITISPEQLREGVFAFSERDERDHLYNKAVFLVKSYWGCPKDVAESLELMLTLWNKAYYRGCQLDIDSLQRCIQKHHEALTVFRELDILDYTESHNEKIREIYDELLQALTRRNKTTNDQNEENTSTGKPKTPARKPKTPTGKALGLIAPRFFPLWDDKIRRAYRCGGGSADDYLKFMKMIKKIASSLPYCAEETEDKTLLKRIDEYNYERFVKKSVQ